MSNVTISNLEVGFANQLVLKGVDLEVPAGSIVSVLGPSGCGKTTLLRAIAGLLPVHQGSISIGGEEVSSQDLNVPPERRRIGWMPQDASLFPHLSVRENIAFGIGKSKQANDRVIELSQMVGLSNLLERSPNQLSGGQAQRVSLARALATRPSILLLDEPFAALDPMLRHPLREEVVALLREQKSTALLVTHDQEEALALSDYVAVMAEGQIVQWGAPQEVYDYPSTLWLARFMGDTVELPGKYADGFVDCSLGKFAVRLIEPGIRDQDEVRVVIRPEWIEIDRSGDDAEVTAMSYTGHDALITARATTGDLIQAKVSSINLPQVGSRVTISIRQPVLAYR